MSDAILDALREIMTSPWIYLAIFGIAALDGFFPVVPAETLVITAGVFAVNGEPTLVFVIAVAAAGAFCGDHISYSIGRFAGTWLQRWMRPGTRRRTAYDRAGRMLAERGGLVLIIARYIPGGRTAATLVMGAVRHPLRSFSFFDAIAGLSWATYSALIGYVGGEAFEDNPLKGLALGIGVAVTITALVEVVRYIRGRLGGGEEPEEEPPEGAEPPPSPADRSAIETPVPSNSGDGEAEDARS